MINRFCHLEGNLVKDPEIKKTEAGREVANITVAVNHFSADKEKKVSYFDVEAWNMDSRFIQNELKKGTRVSIVGSLKQDRWEKDGKTYSKVKIVALSLHPRLRRVQNDSAGQGASQIPSEAVA